MFRLWNNLFIFLCIFLFYSCGFVDLRPIEIKIEPKKMDSLLPAQYSPVILKFNTEMVKNDVEGIIQINSDLGAVNGDKYWKGNELYFVPVSGWIAGIRYSINLRGSIRSADGRELRLDHFIPFYAINKNPPPFLEWHFPFSGESIGTNDLTYEFHFSKPMDKLSVENALVLEGIGNKNFEWLENDRVIKITTDKALAPWSVYRWNIKETAKSVDGVPLPKAYTGHFTTDLDITLPFVTNVFPVLFSNGSWIPTGADIETGLRQEQGIAVLFNKPIGDNVLRSVRFEPALTGKTETLTENSIVFIFTRSPEPETLYTMIISGDTRDKEGLRIGSDHKINFIPNIPYLNITSISVDGNSAINDFSALNNVFPVQIDPETGELLLSIYFSLPFDFYEKQNTPQRITVTPFFPRILPPVALQYVNWISNDRLYMRWEGLSPSDGVTSHFYRIVIPGGKSGISSETGILMKDDFIFYLEAVK